MAHAILWMLLLALPTHPAAPAAGPSERTPEEARNIAIAGRVFREILNAGRFEVADSIYAPDFVNHGLRRDADLAKDQAAVHAERQAFPDMQVTEDLVVAKGDLVTVIWTFRGTHTRAGYGGLPPTGIKVELRGITVWRITDGRIREEWSSFDQLRPMLKAAAKFKWLLIGLVLATMILGWGILRSAEALWRRLRADRAAVAGGLAR